MDRSDGFHKLSHFLDRHLQAALSEKPRAADEGVGARPGALRSGGEVDSAIHLDAVVEMLVAPPDLGLLHLGKRLDDEWLAAKSGIDGHDQEQVDLFKEWLHDPDGTLWEIYTLEGDIDHRGVGQTQELVMAKTDSSCCNEPVVFEHRMNAPVPDSIPLGDHSADEVRLRGTFNLPLANEAQKAILNESLRVLKPGGRLYVHVLTGDRAVDRF